MPDIDTPGAHGDPKMVMISLPYSHPALSSCRFPRERLSAIYTMEPVAPCPDLQAAVRRAVNDPIGAAPLREIAAGRRRAAILVDDMTRPTPAAEVLPFLLAELAEAGIRGSDITLVVGVGSHRPMTAAEIARKVGAEAAREHRVINSRFWDPRHLVHVGTSRDGVRVLIEEEVVRADIRIGVGSIVPHAAVGWSGGGKIVYPGVAGKETVTHFHFTHGLTEENMTGRAACPVRERMEQWVDVLGLDFIVNCILTPEDRVYRVVAGHYRDAQRRGAALGAEVYTRRIKEKADICVAVSYTHDIDFWQGTKGLYSGEALVRDGGTLLLVTPCPEGLGLHTAFPERIGRNDNRETMLGILSGDMPMPEDPLPIPPAAMLARLRRRIDCAVVSPGLSAEDMAKAGYGKFDDVQTGVDALLRKYPDGKIAVVLRSDLTFSGD